MKWSNVKKCMLGLPLIVPAIVYAQEGFRLVPCTGGKDSRCDFCDLAILADNVIDFLIGILILIAVLYLAITGLQIVTSAGNVDAKKILKERLTNIVIGFVLVILSWTLVDLLMKALIAPEQNLSLDMVVANITDENFCGSVAEPVAKNLETVTEPTGANNFSGPGAIAAPSTFTPSGATGTGLSAAEAEAALKAGGIGNGGNVISYEGLQQVAINGVIQMNEECGCNIVVTEATGGSHAPGTYSHENGYKLDMRTHNNEALENYVKTTFSPAGRWSTGEPVYERTTSGGLQRCAFHTTHLDCQFVPGS